MFFECEEDNLLVNLMHVRKISYLHDGEFERATFVYVDGTSDELNAKDTIRLREMIKNMRRGGF